MCYNKTIERLVTQSNLGKVSKRTNLSAVIYKWFHLESFLSFQKVPWMRHHPRDFLFITIWLQIQKSYKKYDKN